MPTAGDEGYEKLVTCPYDKSHEIRRGRMQFHLEKCRKNFPLASEHLVSCTYNKSHVVPKEELQYHMEEECESRSNWDRYSHEVNKVDCPVKNLVPVNAASVPDGGENWDNYESTGSVLEKIKTDAQDKLIYRSLQVAGKSKRKHFRAEQTQRFQALLNANSSKPDEQTNMPSTSSVVESQPLPRPKRQPNVAVVKQDPNQAMAAISKQIKSINLNAKPAVGSVAPSQASSVVNQPSGSNVPSTSQQMPFSYAAASRGRGVSRPESAASNHSMMTALTSQHGFNSSRPSTAMSNATSNYATASLGEPSRPPSAMSNSSVGTSASFQRPPNSSSNRPSTAMNILTSAASYNPLLDDDEFGFCQIPIPGLGRGKRKPTQ